VSKNAPTIDNATTGAVTADNTRSPKDTGINPAAIALSSSLAVQPPSQPVTITILDMLSRFEFCKLLSKWGAGLVTQIYFKLGD
jgi:hypothetical protein